MVKPSYHGLAIGTGSSFTRMPKVAGMFAAAACLASCNQVFYQPMREIIATPDQIRLDWSDVKVEVPGGEKIRGWHLKSRKKPEAVVVHMHGNAENRSTHMNFVAWMTLAGIDVIVFDYRGYGDSEGDPSRAATIEDAGAMIKWTRENPQFSDLPVIVTGQSLGGAVSVPVLAWYARQNPPQYPVDGLILDSTFSSYRRIARDKLAQVWITWPLQWPLSFLVSDDLSPVDDAPAVDIPLLQFHSRNDQIVPFYLGQELFKAYGAKEKQLVEVAVPGHTAAFAVQSNEYREKAVEFIKDIARKRKAAVKNTSRP